MVIRYSSKLTRNLTFNGLKYLLYLLLYFELTLPQSPIFLSKPPSILLVFLFRFNFLRSFILIVFIVLSQPPSFCLFSSPPLLSPYPFLVLPLSITYLHSFSILLLSRPPFPFFYSPFSFPFHSLLPPPFPFLSSLPFPSPFLSPLFPFFSFFLPSFSPLSPSPFLFFLTFLLSFLLFSLLPFFLSFPLFSSPFFQVRPI